MIGVILIVKNIIIRESSVMSGQITVTHKISIVLASYPCYQLLPKIELSSFLLERFEIGFSEQCELEQKGKKNSDSRSFLLNSPPLRD
jgi:hypothetical protein